MKRSETTMKGDEKKTKAKSKEMKGKENEETYKATLQHRKGA